MNVMAQLRGLDTLVLRFENAERVSREEVSAEMADIVDMLYGGVAANLSGGRLNVSSGKLLASIKTQQTEDADSVTGEVYSDGSVPYARILEMGGTTAPHDIVPVNAAALAFLWAGHGGGTGQSGNFKLSSGAIGTDMVFLKIVHHPGSKIPQFAYMRSVLAASRTAIVDRFRGLGSRIWARAAE